MRSRSLPLAALAGVLAFAGPLLAQDKPTVVLRVASVDTLAAKGKYLAKLVDQGDLFDQVEGFLKAFTGPKGVEGLDTTKPLGLYGRLGPNGIDSQVVVLVPITDGDKFAEFMKKQNVPLEKQANGAFKIDVPGSPLPGYVRFANGYGYFTVGQDDAAIEAKNLADPKTVLPADQIGLATLLLDAEQVPAGMKALALQALEDEHKKQKDNLPKDLDEAQRKGQLAGMDLAFNAMKAVVKEGGPLTLKLDLNEAKQELSVGVSFAGQANSGLAKALADLGQAQSVAAGALPTGGIASASLTAAVPAAIRDLVVGEIERGVKDGLAKEPDAQKKGAAMALVESLLPTLKAGEVDLGFALVPTAGGKHNVVLAAKVVKGGDIEKAVKQVVALVPENEKRAIGLTIDLDKADGVNIHGAKAPPMDANGARLFGDGTIHFAVRDDALLLAFGDGSLGAVRTALATRKKPAGVVAASVNIGKFVSLLPPDQAKMIEPIVKKVLAANPQARDTIAVTLDGGKELKLEATMPVTVIQLIGEIYKARQRGL